MNFQNANFDHGLILNDAIPFAPWAAPLNRLPGVQPLGNLPWLIKNEAFAKQIALKSWLYKDRSQEVFLMLEEGEPLADEFAKQLKHKRFIDAALVHQEDFCLLEGEPPFRLLGAFLAFPAGWRLEEKIGAPLWDVHVPIERYDEEISKRVERMMGAIRVGAPLWRTNCLRFDHPNLHSRETENVHTRSGRGRWLRSERQVLTRLPETGGIVFSIHTYLLDLEAQGNMNILEALNAANKV